MRPDKIFIVLMLMLCTSFAFYDDFNGYNSLNDANFIANWIVENNTGGLSIATAPADSITFLSNQYIDQYTTVKSAIYPNITSANISGNFIVSFILRSQSMLVGHGVWLAFYTNESNTNSHAYIAGIKNPSGQTINTYIRRCANGILDGESCGLLLNGTTSSFSLINYHLPEDYIITVSMQNYIISLYINGVLQVSYKDTSEIYTSGGFAIGTASISPATNYYIDNFNTNATLTIGYMGTGYLNPSAWNILGWLNNIENLPGYFYSPNHNINDGINCYIEYPDSNCVLACSLFIKPGCDRLSTNAGDIIRECGVQRCDYSLITYSLKGTPITYTVNSPLGAGWDDFAVPGKYYDGINAYFYVLGQPFTEAIRSSIHILPLVRLQASAPGCSYVSPQYWISILAHTTDVTQYIAPIPTTANNDYWSTFDWNHDNTGDFVVDNTFGFICQNPNNITAYYDFYNTATNPGTLLFTKNVTFPIGYLVTFNGNGIGSNFTVDYNTPFDCIFNASICAGAGNPPIVNQTCPDGICIVPDGFCASNPSDPSCQNQVGGIANALMSPAFIAIVVCLTLGLIGAVYGGQLIGAFGFIGAFFFMTWYGLFPLWVGLGVIMLASFVTVYLVRDIFTGD